MIIIGFRFLQKNWRFISWRARWPTDGIIVGAQFSIKTLLAGSEASTSQTICNRCPYSKQGTVSKFVQDYQDFDHRGFPNMGRGGGGPHGGGSRGGGRHGGNFRRSDDSSCSGVTHPFNSGGVSRGCGGKFYGGRQGYGTGGHGRRQVTTPWLKDCILNGSLALKKLKAVDVSHLTSCSSAEVNLDDTDVIPSEFDDIADTFINIPVKNYPLVITFQKFLMMLDGTLESSFFERFRKASEDSHGECSDGKVSYEDYCLLAKSRSSTLTKEKREIVYNLFHMER
ncbi:UvrD-like helicase, ATP-binding domain, P-loop containing nucleoside triphosphate hydrolase [Tanacetum coccineum]